MKLISWNVNGIRAAMKKGFLEFLKTSNLDILCIQETKARPEQVEFDFDGFYQFWNSAEKKGYSGTAVFTKIEPLDIRLGMDVPDHDNEGRIITLEYENYYLVNVYTPNSQRGLMRLGYREKQWDVDFLKFVKNLEEKKPVVFCGDLNVAHKEIDLANPKSNRKNAGFTDEERAGFDNILKAGFIDTLREFNQQPGQYSWWSYRMNARARNIGWRIDYFCISEVLRPKLQDAFILPEIMGSDHCPVGIILQ